MPFSRPTLRLLVLPGLSLAVLAGCASSNPCGGNQDYLSARDRPQLQMPEGVTGSERLAGNAMVIPPASPEPQKLDPAPKCLDQPPPFFGKRAVMAGSAEEAVYIWAAAWANQKPDQVAAFYSPEFQASDGGGAGAFIEERKQDVASGQAPDARLDELKGADAAGGKRVVTFVQRFGRDAYLKELTLAKDAQGWRIVGERTLKKL
jgi:hypothetical protein